MRTFEGVKVVDFTQVLSGPYATYQLAMLGADVIKVEQPGIGDQSRQILPVADPTLREAAFSCIFLSGNAGKRSMTLDLKNAEARDIVHRLVREADVLVENFKAGTMDRMGFGWEALKEINPRLVYCSISGYGQTGPKAGVAAYDPTVQAASGIMAVTGTPESGPIRAGVYVCDMSSGMAAAFAIAGALFKRERTGEGSRIDVSMQDVGVSFMGPLLAQAQNGYDPKPLGSRSQSNNPMADTFPTGDGVIIIVPTVEAQSVKIWQTVGRPELATDPRFSTLEARIANNDACVAALREALAADSARGWERRFAAAGVPSAAVQTLPEVFADPQSAHRGLFRTLPSPAGDRALTYINTPFKIAGEETGAETAPPLLGGATDAVLAELGYGAAEIAALRAKGAV